jgi:hypothetical protein
MSEPVPKLAGEPTPAAIRLRITAGILYAAARFVPVPLVDDLLRGQIVRWMVLSTLPGALPRDAVKALWSGGGCLEGCLGQLAMIPIRLILYPVRMLLAVVLGVRWISRDIVEMLLLGRVLDHGLASGMLEGGKSPETIAVLAHEIRTAFDDALRGTDTRLLGAILTTAIGPIRELVSAGVRSLRGLRRSGAEQPTIEPGDKQVIDASASRIERALMQPEVRRFIADFDARVIARLADLETRRLAPKS